jgi:competence protein ComEC
MKKILKPLYRHYSWSVTVFVLLIMNGTLFYQYHLRILSWMTAGGVSLAGMVLGIVLKNKKMMLTGILCLILSGIQDCQITSHRSRILEAKHRIRLSEGVLGTVSGYPVRKKNHGEYRLSVFAIRSRDSQDYVTAKPFTVLVRVPGDHPLPAQGDAVRIEKKISFAPEKIGSFRYRDYLESHGICGIIHVRNGDPATLPEDLNRRLENRFMQGLQKIRSGILSRLKDRLNEKSYTLILSAVFGDRAEMDAEILSQFRDTGLLHLLAISGQHIAFIAGMISWMTGRWISRTKSGLISLAVLTFYILMITSGPSSIRAWLMAAIGVIFFTAGYHPRSLHTLCLAGTGMLLVNPGDLTDAGFQLSFLATAGILILDPPISEKLKIVPRTVRGSVSVTVSAFLAVMMLQWRYFGQLPLFSLISSPVLVFLFTLLFCSYFPLILILLIFPFRWTACLIDIPTGFFLDLIALLNRIPPVRLPEIPLWIVWCWFPFLIAVFYLFIPAGEKILRDLKIRSLLIDKRRKLT